MNRKLADASAKIIKEKLNFSRKVLENLKSDPGQNKDIDNTIQSIEESLRNVSKFLADNTNPDIEERYIEEIERLLGHCHILVDFYKLPQSLSSQNDGE